MSEIPDVIPIAPRPDPLEKLGQLPDGRQFLGVLSHGPEGWMPVVLFFSGEGVHLESEHDRAIPGEEGEPPAEAAEAFDQMIRRLEPYQTEPVTLQPFETRINGQRFGLVPDTDAGRVVLQPQGRAFSAPWEGQPDG